MLAIYARNQEDQDWSERSGQQKVGQAHHSLMTDEQAMWRVQMQDDHVAFARLLERWQGPIRNLCARMTGDVHRGEDIAQEAFARVFAKRKEFRPEAKFSTWLWRIALNLCYDELRRRTRRNECSLSAERSDEEVSAEKLSEEPAPDQRLVSGEECELVRQALVHLPEIQRAALVLRYCDGLKLREIAEILQIPETTAASRIAAGLSQITRVLEPQLGKKTN